MHIKNVKIFVIKAFILIIDRGFENWFSIF